MPDLMSHLLIGLILTELFNVKKKSIVLLGALIPDLLSKMSLLFAYLQIHHTMRWDSFHTPFMAFLLGILVSAFFRYDNLNVIIYFNIGSMSHFISDLTIRHFGEGGTRLLFPFSIKSYSLNLLWPEQSIYVLIAAALIYLIIKISRRKIWAAEPK